MCLAIASKGKRVEETHIENAFAHNSDGAGYAYVKDGEIIIEKGFFNVGELLESYASMPENAPHLLHFRLATAGKENAENCHPFKVSDGIAYIHNGIIHDARTCANYSDTYYFNEDYLKPLLAKRYALLKEPAFIKLLEEFIGKFNKLAFLNREGQIILVNEEAGHWDDDEQIWYSNRSYVTYTSYSSNALPSHYQNMGGGFGKITPETSAIVEYHKGMGVSDKQAKLSFDEWIEAQLEDYATINEFTGGIWSPSH
jgi:predicted glutamine amidotransferase